jgi:hypothetical protein
VPRCSLSSARSRLISQEGGNGSHAQALSGWTPLAFAAGSGRVSAVRCLLDAGASRTLCDHQGVSPHQVALEAARKVSHQRRADRGHQKVATLLKDYVRQPAKLVMAMQRLGWACCQLSCGAESPAAPPGISWLSADLVQQVVRRYKQAPRASVVLRAQAEATSAWASTCAMALVGGLRTHAARCTLRTHHSCTVRRRGTERALGCIVLYHRDRTRLPGAARAGAASERQSQEERGQHPVRRPTL